MQTLPFLNMGAHRIVTQTFRTEITFVLVQECSVFFRVLSSIKIPSAKEDVALGAVSQVNYYIFAKAFI